jgi:hypothetical protein
MSRLEDIQAEAEEAGEPNQNGTSERQEPPTAPIDEDVAGSVNAALPDADE